VYKSLDKGFLNTGIRFKDTIRNSLRRGRSKNIPFEYFLEDCTDYCTRYDNVPYIGLVRQLGRIFGSRCLTSPAKYCVFCCFIRKLFG